MRLVDSFSKTFHTIRTLPRLERRHAYFFAGVVCVSMLSIWAVDDSITPETPELSAQEVAALALQEGPMQMLLPVYHAKLLVTSTFGERSSSRGYRKHNGVDIAPIGGGNPNVLAAERGWVVFTGSRSGYGNTVELYHRDGTWTRYAHLSRIMVRQGEIVSRGQMIGNMGNSGRTVGRTGIHLHFEHITTDGSPVEPSIQGYGKLAYHNKLDYNHSYYAIYPASAANDDGNAGVSSLLLAAKR